MGRSWLGVEVSAVARNVFIGALVIVLSSGAAFAQSQPAQDTPTADEKAAPAAEQPATETPAADAPATEQPAAAPAETPASQPAPQAGDFQRMEDDFKNFLHFAIIGRFDMAQGVARSLLQHPDLNPLSKEGAEHLLDLSEKYENSLDTLLLLVNNPKLGDDAKKILDLVYESHRRARLDPQRIKENIERLAGEPNQRSFGMDRLLESGEYAVPWMLETLADPARSRLHPFAVRAMPQLGRAAVNPLVQALSANDDVIQKFAAQALGKIGYPQALPYLKRLAGDNHVNPAVRDAAVEAINLIAKDPALKQMAAAPAVALFVGLAEQYYDNVESVSPDPRENRANVWFPGGKSVMRVEVPRDIYNPVMSMRCCEASLELTKKQPPVAALWVAANFRREAKLGLDVQSEEPAQTEDLTRPPNFPRSIYFGRSAGPDVCRMVLARAIHDNDRDVALGAIASLAVTAGPAAMTSPSGDGTSSLVEALQFPDLLVRTRAALAVGRAMPAQPFRGSEDVVRVLAGALALTGKQFFLLVESDQSAGEQIAAALTRQGAVVIAAKRLDEALSRAERELPHLDGIFVASDLASPHVVEAVRLLADHPRFSLAPVMVYVKTSDNVIADRVTGASRKVGVVFVENGNGDAWPKLAETLIKQYPRTAAKYGYKPLSQELSLKLALDAAATLRDMAAGESHVFDVRPAERLLADAQKHPSEELRIACLRVLALLDSPTAQRAIAGVAMSPNATESLRLAAFSALADSGRHFGSRLEGPALQTLVQQALKEPNLVLRTGASQALGALNPPGTSATEVILAQPSMPVLVTDTQPAQ